MCSNVIATAQEHAATSADEFLDMLHPHSKLFRHYHHADNVIFRGHADARWNLLSKAKRIGTNLFRNGSWDIVKDTWSARDQVRAEFHTLQRFFATADRFGLELPEDGQVMRQKTLKHCEEKINLVGSEFIWPPPELISLLALMQHHGVPTRLLDWSYEYRAAAYFAAREAAFWQKEITVRGINAKPPGVENICVWFCPVDLLIKSRIIGSHNCVVMAEVPRSSNRNLLAQKGLFLYSTQTITRNLETADRRPMDKVMFDQDAGLQLSRVSLSISEAPRLLRLLTKDYVSAARLFPGFDGVAESLLEQRAWDSL